MAVRRVKYPVRAALARVVPIEIHLANMTDYLVQAGHPEFRIQILAIRQGLSRLEHDIKPFREK